MLGPARCEETRVNFLRQGPPPDGTRWSLYAHHLGDYMRRWILRTPWGTLRIHHILRSDDDTHLHDHPFDFTSFLLSGGYIEETAHPEICDRKYARIPHVWPRFSIVRKRAEEAHRLVLTRPVWTFVVSGPKRRSWGFHTERGWVNHRDYLHLFPEVVAARVGPAGHAAALELDAQRRARGEAP